jgi:undecaprenyl-diphosphatase
VLACAGFGWHFVGRHFHAAPGEQPSPVRLALLLAAGFAVILAAGSGFAEIAEEIGYGGEVARFDDVLAMSLAANVGQDTRRIFAAITRLGDPSTLVGLAIIVAAALVAAGYRRLAFGWLAALAGNALLNYILKAVFERVRPVHDPSFVAGTGWSFPSGHSSGAIVGYGLLSYVLVRLLPRRWHLPMVVSAAALAFTIGSSRVFVGVHFASDVIAGFLSGGAWLAVCVIAMEFARHYRRG